MPHNHRSVLPAVTLLLAGWLAGSAVGSAPDAATVLARSYVPNRWLPQGEVRLVERDDECVVQTALRTRFEGRVVGYILEQEAVNWGQHEDAAAYAGALESAAAEYRRRQVEAGRDVGLVIEFVDRPSGGVVRFGFATVRPGEDGFEVESLTRWRILDLSDHYVRKNQELIIQDTFKDRARNVLGRLHQCRREAAAQGRD